MGNSYQIFITPYNPNIADGALRNVNRGGPTMWDVA